MFDFRLVGHARRIVYLAHLAVFVEDVVTYVGHGRDDIHIKLTVEAFLHNFHVEQSEEAAAESKA